MIERLTDLATNLQIVLLDVDGVMTDGGLILIGSELEAKRFHVHDGMGINMLRAAGMMVGIVTSRTSQVVERRSNELSIDEIFQGINDKTSVLTTLYNKYGINPAQTAFIGDDLQDLPLLRQVGISIAVQNAVTEVKDFCSYVTKTAGGYGAVREAANWLLDLRGDKERVIQSITAQDRVSG